MSESAVKIKTKILTKDANTQLLTLENKMIKLAEKADAATRKLEELAQVKIPTAEYEEVTKHIEECRVEMSRLQEQIENASGATIEPWEKELQELTKTIEYAKSELADMEEDGKAFIDPATTKDIHIVKVYSHQVNPIIV